MWFVDDENMCHSFSKIEITFLGILITKKSHTKASFVKNTQWYMKYKIAEFSFWILKLAISQMRFSTINHCAINNSPVRVQLH